MAVITPVSTAVVSVEERAWRATIETPKGAPYTLLLHREKRSLDASGAQVGEKVILPPIELAFDAIQNETVTVGGQTLTVSQLTTFLIAYFDQKAQQLGV